MRKPEVFVLEHGFLTLPKGPGLGVEIDEATVRDAAAKGHEWVNPLWHLEDGTLG